MQVCASLHIYIRTKFPPSFVSSLVFSALSLSSRFFPIPSPNSDLSHSPNSFPSEFNSFPSQFTLSLRFTNSEPPLLFLSLKPPKKPPKSALEYSIVGSLFAKQNPLIILAI